MGFLPVLPDAYADPLGHWRMDFQDADSHCSINKKAAGKMVSVCKTVKNSLTVLRHLSDGVGNNIQ